MSINVETLKEQLTASEAELEQLKAHVYRTDGVVQLLKHLIAQAEQPETPSTEEATSVSKAEVNPATEPDKD